jgi:hypothetical protein
MNSWEDKEFHVAVDRTGRKKLILAGLWTEVCVAFPAFDAVKAGYEVYVVADAIGGLSAVACEHEGADVAGRRGADHRARSCARAAARLGTRRCRSTQDGDAYVLHRQPLRVERLSGKPPLQPGAIPKAAARS